MNLQQIIIGRAPDFILKSGQTIYHHKVVIEITPTGRRSYMVTKDHVSMHQLIRVVREWSSPRQTGQSSQRLLS